MRRSGLRGSVVRKAMGRVIAFLGIAIGAILAYGPRAVGYPDDVLLLHQERQIVYLLNVRNISIQEEQKDGRLLWTSPTPEFARQMSGLGVTHVMARSGGKLYAHMETLEASGRAARMNEWAARSMVSRTLDLGSKEVGLVLWSLP